jgi:hypothetical protein
VGNVLVSIYLLDRVKGVFVCTGEQRNHGLKYESDCVRKGIGIKIFMNLGRFCERLFCWVFVIQTAIKRKHSFYFWTRFCSCCVSYENCKRPRRNFTPKRENSFAILISVCNFHISLQFSYQFAILTFRCIVPTWTFAIFIWVCNFHIKFANFISVCNSHVMTPALTIIAFHGFYVTMT